MYQKLIKAWNERSTTKVEDDMAGHGIEATSY